MEDSEALSGLFAALADPTRRAILLRLAQGDANVSELAQPHAMSLPAVSKHLKVLERAGLIRRSRRVQQRPCHLQPLALAAIDDWLEACRAIAANRADAPDDFQRNLRKNGKMTVNPEACLPTCRQAVSRPFSLPVERV